MDEGLVTVTLSDGSVELFALGHGDLPEQLVYDDDDKPWAHWRRVVRYTIDPSSGALLVGYGIKRKIKGHDSKPDTLGDFGVNELHIVRTFAPGRWAAVAGGDYWQPV